MGFITPFPSFGESQHPFANYFDVQKGDRVLIHRLDSRLEFGLLQDRRGTM
jgi:hypothetical protein